ncbi:uncharacterized protein LOC103391737 isoform X2 [Cynoglossus semilaevis]|uniref:uncharacterized protein LOC103391737 isoform X2 n=1 Tax=Cynoglossus semilaevis TaxID=244447 RepID=UPI000498260E|nr:uncharacterized protein LOC103391737 isoform X2 [Cynoglossus semilaevis]
MDVSIAVSLIRGQLDTVVKRAVNGAVETVLAEMLKVVGVKFEEVKAQLALMKRDNLALQRENAIKTKENDNIRAKLRYTELKLKYYRQGVAEELQQRSSVTAVVHVNQSSFPQTQRITADLSPTVTSSTCSAQTRTPETALTRSNQESTTQQSTGRCSVRSHSDTDEEVISFDSSEQVLHAPIYVDTSPESLNSNTVLLCTTEQDATESVDAVVAPPPPPPLVQALDYDERMQSNNSPLSPGGSNQAVKEEDEEEVICIKEEQEEEGDPLLLDYQMQQSLMTKSEAQSTVTEWLELQTNQKTPAGFSAAIPGTYMVVQQSGSPPSLVDMSSGVPTRQAVRPWSKDLSLYEEYKLRRNEQRRRNHSRRREQEKSLPQPMLADLVRVRREKTRLRVAKWRAKRKLQAHLIQAQTHGGTEGFSNWFAQLQPGSVSGESFSAWTCSSQQK